MVFLHGFGGLAKQWWGLQMDMSFHTVTYAFDLPGHGESLDFPDAGPPIVAARAVVKELDDRGIEKAHFVGHSMGGAISSLIGLIAPEKVASLNLLAPGGFGPEFDLSILKKWAAAQTREELEDVMPLFFGKGFEIGEKIINFQYEARNRPGAVASQVKIMNAISVDGKQGVLPVDDVLSGPYPVALFWGDDDQILPVSQAYEVGQKVEQLHILEGAGHSPAEEAPDQVRAVLKARLSA